MTRKRDIPVTTGDLWMAVAVILFCLGLLVWMTCGTRARADDVKIPGDWHSVKVPAGVSAPPLERHIVQPEARELHYTHEVLQRIADLLEKHLEQHHDPNMPLDWCIEGTTTNTKE